MADFPNLLPPNLQGLGLSAPEQAEDDRQRLGQDEFFELMVAQLRNQDPVNPLESNEFLSQVAQFSTVSGIQEMQQSIAELASSLQSGQALQASMLVGRDVLVPGSVGAFSPGGTLAGAVDLPGATGALELSIFDPAGQLVRHLELGAQPPGVVRFAWDGLTDDGAVAPAGNYVVQAGASIDGSPQAMATLVESRVESVTLSSNPSGLTLNLKGIGPVNLNNVRELL